MSLISNPSIALCCLYRSAHHRDTTDNNPVSGLLRRPGTYAPSAEHRAPITKCSEDSRLPSCPGPEADDCTENAEDRKPTDAADVHPQMMADDQDQTPEIIGFWGVHRERPMHHGGRRCRHCWGGVCPRVRPVERISATRKVGQPNE